MLGGKMIIRIYGTGCPKCKLLEENAKKAVAELQLDASVEKVSDMEQIIDAGVIMAPAIGIDDKIVSTGRVLSAAEIVKLLR